MDYFMGVDIGTTSVKAIAFHDTGEIICKHAVSYNMIHPHPACSEQNPDEIFNGAVHAINEVMRTLQPAKPSFISFSAAMHSLIVVNEQGGLLTNCIIWADNRAAEIARELLDTPQGQQIYHSTGVPVHAMSPLCKILWLKEYEPDIFNNAGKFIGIKEYIFFKLFHTYTVDTAVASATGLLNTASLQWEQSILQMIPLAEEKLSKLVPVQQLYYYTPANNPSFSLQLSSDIPVVIGGSDGALANLGSGSPANDSMSVTIGTSAAVRILSNSPVTGKDMSIFCYHAIDDQYIIGGASNNGAVVIQWIRESLLQTTASYEELYQLAENIPPGSDGLIFIPYILGERAPVWNSDARGVFFGFSINHTKAHMVRAAMEGVIYNVYSTAKLLMKIMPVKEIYAAGGFAQSTVWLQLLADVFNCKVLVSGSPESSALGAVVVGIKALNLPVKIHPAVIASYEPDQFLHEQYQKQSQKFERLYRLLKYEFVSSAMSNPVSV